MLLYFIGYPRLRTSRLFYTALELHWIDTRDYQYLAYATSNPRRRLHPQRVNHYT
jgi:hypothetical protein